MGALRPDPAGELPSRLGTGLVPRSDLTPTAALHHSNVTYYWSRYDTAADFGDAIWVRSTQFWWSWLERWGCCFWRPLDTHSPPQSCTCQLEQSTKEVITNASFNQSYNNNLHQRQGYVILSVYLSVVLFVSRITQKVTWGFGRKFQKMFDLTQHGGG